MDLTLIPVLVFITFVLLVYALIRPGPSISQRLQPYAHSSERSRKSELDKPFSTRVLWPFVASVAKLVARISPQNLHEKTTAELEQAGNPMRTTTFLALRGVCTFVLPVLFGFQLLFSRQPVSLPQIGILALLFYLGARLPVTWLRLKIDARQKVIEKSLPDALDLITVCMEAGLAFDGALARVVEKLKGPLSDEFGRVLQEVNLGKLRREALRDLGTRTGVADLRSFVAAIVQADQMGIPIGEVLRVQSDELRVRRRQRAEEQAMKAPVKMLFPLIFCILPAMMVVLLGPAIWSIYVNIIAG